jgi:hypothetical protein
MPRTRAVSAPKATAPDFDMPAQSFHRSHLAENKSARTIDTYMEATRLLGAFLTA